jgi:hypothetical protein
MAGAPVHPMHGPNKFKLGVFSMNSDGGLTLTKVPERWPAIWSEIMEVSQLADRAGFEFLLPIARWKGFGGEMNSREWSYETLTHAAALGVRDRARTYGASGVCRESTHDHRSRFQRPRGTQHRVRLEP